MGFTTDGETRCPRIVGFTRDGGTRCPRVVDCMTVARPGEVTERSGLLE